MLLWPPLWSLSSKDLRPSSGCTRHSVAASIAVVAVEVLVVVGTSAGVVEGGDEEVAAGGVGVVDENGEWVVDTEKAERTSVDKDELVRTECTVVAVAVVDIDVDAEEASEKHLTVVSGGTKTHVAVAAAVVVVEDRSVGLVAAVVEGQRGLFVGRRRGEQGKKGQGQQERRKKG